MKKFVSFLLVLVMVAAMAAGCANEKPAETTTEPAVVVPASALEILETIWAQYGDDEKFFTIGGDFGNPVDNAPGNYSLEDEGITTLLYVPADQLANIDQAASMIHMMNANTFTSACYELTEGADSAAFVQSVKENILSRQWMCGFPEILIIVEVDGCIVSAFGNGEVVQLFKDKLEASFSCTTLVEEPIA